MVPDSRGQGDSRTARRLNEPRPVRVAAEEGIPAAVGQVRVSQVREEWRVEEGWWTRRPLRRRYFDLVLEDGRNTVVFLDRRQRRWYTQRA